MRLDERELCLVALGVLGIIVGGSYAYVHLTDRPKQIAMPATPEKVGQRNDVALGGVWRMLDVDDISKSPRSDRSALGVGKRVMLLLQAQDPRFATEFGATVIGGSGQGLRYAAQWTNAIPAGGPQLVDFNPEHVFRIL